MDRKKKREKFLGTMGEADGAPFQPGDVQPWNKEADQHENAKKHAVAGGPNGDSPMQPSFPMPHWPHTQHFMMQQQTLQQPSMLQTYTQPQQQGAQNQSQTPEASGQTPAPGHYPLHTGPADIKFNGVPPSSCVPQTPGGTPAPFNNPGGFGFPPPPFPGMWDPMSWWMHHAHHQAVFPYPFPGYGGGFGYPTPPPPSVGPSQRGFIKPPPGLSRKHQRLWEAQSMENVQLWATNMQLAATVARAEAEISCQRAKILKLECDLQAIKAHYDALMESSAAAPVPPPARRGRGKKTASIPVAIVGLPASQATPVRIQSRKARTMIGKLDLAKNMTELSSEEKPKITGIGQMVGLVDSSHDHDQKSNMLTVGPNRIESGAEKDLHRDPAEMQAPDNQNHIITGEKGSLNFNHLGQNSPFRPTLPVGVIKETYCEPTVELKDTSASFKSGSSSVDKQGVISDSRDDWPVTSGGDAARNAILGGLLQAQYASVMERSNNANGSRKAIPGWQYTGEDASDDQDEVVASGQDDDEPDDDDETALDDISGGKIGNYMVLDSGTALPKEMTALSRW